MAVYTIREAKEIIKKLQPLGIPILLNGGTGVGKTSMVRELSEELGLPLIDIRLATELPENVGGIPQVINDTYFVKVLNKEFAPAFESGAILFFDELNRSISWVRNSAMSVFYERTLGGRKLHPDTIVIGATNMGLDFKDTDIVDKALLARFAILNIITDSEELVNYLDERYPISASIIASKLQTLSNKLYEENRYDQLIPTFTPRNVEYASKVIEAYHDDPMLRKILYAVISPDIADILLADLDFSTIKRILAGEDVEVEDSKIPTILAVISSMKLEEKEFMNALRFAKKVFEKFGGEDSVVGFLVNMGKRNRELVVKNISTINKEFPNLRNILTL
jgi:hypothetical protein